MKTTKSKSIIIVQLVFWETEDSASSASIKNSKYWASYVISSTQNTLSYYLPIAGGRLNWIHTFPRVLVLCEMQSVSSKIWTHVAVSISYYDNHYNTGTS